MIKMANKNPVITKEFEENKIKAFGDVKGKLGSKVFGVRLPIDTEKKLLSMPQKDRVIFIRETIVKGVKKMS